MCRTCRIGDSDYCARWHITCQICATAGIVGPAVLSEIWRPPHPTGTPIFYRDHLSFFVSGAALSSPQSTTTTGERVRPLLEPAASINPTAPIPSTTCPKTTSIWSYKERRHTSGSLPRNVPAGKREFVYQERLRGGTRHQNCARTHASCRARASPWS